MQSGLDAIRMCKRSKRVMHLRMRNFLIFVYRSQALLFVVTRVNNNINVRAWPRH
jgi:hypothetical protein